ncbi:MAG: DUF3124 domain-containing protein [Planctomycetes bacterium]|nr:DUF3124 domain-containing protein [Planctomycetota bacterium]MCH9726554.1 DUF3124 domain-containing protein [Planctomycetota bacterium]MCH9779223.1 DUF3124 domain-containing protein [Planctomycetota bacterium]MCH9793168.1 DUF3124 domain-containing protein [Planctomycetota bacterium]MDF1743330.1 DUF3124 domain-containing protein [Gimesia sp.]
MIGQQKKEHSDWSLWLWENWIGLFLVLFLLIAVIVGGAVFLDYRLAKIEDRLQYVPPRSYQPPELTEYQAENISLDKLSTRQLVYVPSYSHIYYHGGAPLLLETTLSIRNIDQSHSIYLNSIEYFNTQGKLVKKYLDQTIKLAPFQTIEFLVEDRDSSGGSGANFLVEWGAEIEVDKPLIETVMVGVSGSQAISFSRSGVGISSVKQKSENAN